MTDVFSSSADADTHRAAEAAVVGWHTPWTAEWGDETSDWHVMAAVSEPDESGITRQPNVCTLSDHFSGDVARLIAAAPDLLESAIGLRAAQRAYMADRGNDALGASVGAAAERLDAAIAKAVSQ